MPAWGAATWLSAAKGGLCDLQLLLTSKQSRGFCGDFHPVSCESGSIHDKVTPGQVAEGAAKEPQVLSPHDSGHSASGLDCVPDSSPWL